MRRAFPIICLLAVLALAPAASASSTTKVLVLKVEGAIDRPLLSYLDDRLAAAQESGAVVVLQLDTSGTLDQDGVALAQRLIEMDVPVLAWVGPAPARASGAGLLLMYASSLAAVSPGSQTGPLNPIDLAEPGRAYPGLRETIQGWLDARDKGGDLDREDEPLPGADALDLGIAQAAAQSVPELLNVVDGRTVQTAAGPVTLRTRIATNREEADERVVDIAFDNLGPIQRVQHGVASPSMIYFLLVIGLACLAFELTQPGFGFAGFSGLGMIALAAYGIWVVPPTWPGLLLLVGGVVLMTVDVRLRSLGPLTALGLAAFGAGSFLAWSGTADAIAISPWLIGGAVAASALYYGFGLTVAIQSRDRIVNTQRGLVGLVGEARGTLSPEGPVYVKGAMWRGRSAGDPIETGTRVRVRSIDGLVLKVEAEPGAELSPRDSTPA